MKNDISTHFEKGAFHSNATVFDLGPEMPGIVYMRHILRQHKEETLHLTALTVLETCNKTELILKIAVVSFIT